MLVEVGIGAQGVAEVGAAQLTRFLSLHGGHVHPVIIDKRQRAVGLHKDVVRLQVAVGERLRQQPHGKSAEVVCQHLEGVSVVDVPADVAVERLALHPVHQQHGKLAVVRAVGVYKQLMVVISYLCKIGRLHKLKLVGNLAVSLLAPLLLACKAFHSVHAAGPYVFHFKDNGEVAA